MGVDVSVQRELAYVGPQPARSQRPWRRGLVGYGFITPNLVGIVLFTFVPLVFSVVVSFTDWSPAQSLSNAHWVGFGNFTHALGDPEFWDGARLTAIYVGVAVPLTLAFGLLLALPLEGPVVGRKVLRLIFFLPFVVNSVAISATWIVLYDPQYGPINAVLRALGMSHPPLWLASSHWAMPAIIVMTIWSGVGYNALLYGAALQDVPQDLVEAATLDGANAWRRFRHITLPFLAPVTFFLLVTGLIYGSQSFGIINLMTAGGPGTSTTVLSYYVYQNGFQFYRFGYAASMSVLLFLAILVLAVVLWVGQRRSVQYGR